MRILSVCLYLASAVACAASGSGPDTTPSPHHLEYDLSPGFDISTLEGFTLDRTIGGWGNGSTYTVSLERSGAAAYHGEARTPRIGAFSAFAAQSVVDSAFALLAPSGALAHPRAIRCYDYEGLRIAIKQRGADTISFGNTCPPNERMYRVAAALDTLLETLEWRRVP